MANIENIVKVMNFHALLRVDKSKKKAEDYFEIREKLNKVMCEIYYNKNLNLDKKLTFQKKDGLVLNIYIANDLGFCGNFNSLVAKSFKEDKDCKKIIIGKKIARLKDDDTVFSIIKENFEENFNDIQDYIYELIVQKQLKEVNVVYNRYYNINDIRLEKEQIFPFEIENNDELDLDVDFVNETKVSNLLSSLISFYICFQIRISLSNSLASENVMRQEITREAKKKIIDINEEKQMVERREKKSKNFKSQIANYRQGGSSDDRQNNSDIGY